MNQSCLYNQLDHEGGFNHFYLFYDLRQPWLVFISKMSLISSVNSDTAIMCANFVCVHFMTNILKTTDVTVIAMLYQLTIAISMMITKCFSLSSARSEKRPYIYLLYIWCSCSQKCINDCCCALKPFIIFLGYQNTAIQQLKAEMYSLKIS